MKTVSSRTKEKIGYEDFLIQYEDTRAEWVDGDIIMVPPASRQHQDIAGFLVNLLRPYVESHNLGRVLLAPFSDEAWRGYVRQRA